MLVGASRQALGCSFLQLRSPGLHPRHHARLRANERQLVCTLVGDYKAEETPVPIPNTEVKLRLPMILLSGKVGYRRHLGPVEGNLDRATFIFGLRAGS